MQAAATLAEAQASALLTSPPSNPLPAQIERDDPNPRAPLAQPSTAKLSESLVERLWQRMLAMFGHTWHSQYGRSPEGIAAETWASGLAGLSGAQLAEGLRACFAEGREWPPSAPRFRAMCFGIPSFAVVEWELTHHHAERTPFARLVWSKIDTYRLSRADSDAAEKLVQRAYDMAAEHVLRGGALPEPSIEIEHKPAPRKPADPEVAAKTLADIEAMLRQPIAAEGVPA